MAGSVGFVSNLQQMFRMHDGIARVALKSAAIVVQNEAKKNARGGFKSGDFVTTGWNTITHVVLLSPAPHAQVGSVREHFLYWELGHFNIFTRQYERKPWLIPAFMSTRTRQQEAATKAAHDFAARQAVSLGNIGFRAFGRI